MLSQYTQILNSFYSNPNNQPMEKYPGATRVLSATKDMAGLNAWRERVGDEEADRIIAESHLIGNSLDTMFNESLSNLQFDPEQFRGEPGYNLWKQLEPTIKKIEPIAVQAKVWSDGLRVMGYTDCIGFLNGIPTVIDCKNSKREKSQEHLQDYYYQCTMYSLMLYDMTGLRFPQIAVLVARRDSPFPQIEIRQTKHFIPGVLTRLQQYNEENRR